MIHYTYEEVLQSLKEIVHAKGEDYLYHRHQTRCLYYEKNGEPSCLVGHFLYENELVMAHGIEDYEDKNAENVVGILEANNIAAFDDRATDLLQKAQECQDWGQTWGQSLDTAIAAVTRKYGA